ncbi:MAG: ferrous iron transport protein A [Runella slithyformis]|nr:MAG: ferrous iron transport protein A [Runella slithyformis]
MPMPTAATKTIADLKTGERAIIRSFRDVSLSLKLLEMGCLPGTEIVLNFKAPFGDPIGIQMGGYCLSMRKAEAATILVV